MVLSRWRAGSQKWASLTPQTPSLKGWVACSCVMSMHYQTIVLLGGARPVWPDSTQAYMQCLSLDYQCFYTIPECTIDLTSVLTRNLDAQMTTNIVMMVILFIPIGVMLVLLIFRAVSKYRLQQGSQTVDCRLSAAVDDRDDVHDRDGLAVCGRLKGLKTAHQLGGASTRASSLPGFCFSSFKRSFIFCGLAWPPLLRSRGVAC